MKIFDGERVLSKVTLFLSPQEAKELAQAAAELAAHPLKHHHHVFDSSYSAEIAITVHTAENLHLFDAKSRSIIESG
jgi:hypothetical protein